jgi:hypothetical protein
MIFAIGLFKKTGLADGIQPLVALAFGPGNPSFDQAWIGALAYTFQLYFDFSGYSDMAIGISLMFGIFLPLNFNSPYKATSIVDFWRRWHMTLSQFLRDYLYIPARRQPARPGAALRQSDDHDAARRPLAWRGLDLCHLGRAARPNSQSLVLGGPEAWRWLAWRPSPAWALLLALGFVLALGQMSDVSPFLYYRF